MPKKFEELVQQGLREQKFTHAYVETGFLNETTPRAHFEFYPDKRYVFDCSSTTKALVTTMLLFDAVHEERIELDPQILEFLTHKSGFKFWANFFTECVDGTKKYRQTLKQAFKVTEQKRDNYSDLNFLWLGMFLEEELEKNLHKLFYEFYSDYFKELCFYQPVDKDICVSTGFSAVRGRELLGEINDDNAAALGKPVGHTGLFASGKGFSQYLRDIWDMDAMELLKQNDFAGWRRGDDFSSKVFAGGNAVGHYGFTGCGFWVDPETSGYVVLLTNRVKMQFAPDQAWREFRRDIFQAANDILDL